MKKLKTPFHVRARRRANKWREFPVNTCPSSRHVQLMAEILAKGKRYPMIDEEPQHVAGSMLNTVASLYAARTKIKRLEARLAKMKGRR